MSIHLVRPVRRSGRRVLALLAPLVVATSTGTAAASSAPPTASSPAGPTIVLVHGAFADASSWHGVIAELVADGHGVIAPPNPLRGVAADAQYLSEFLATIEGPIVLVGHSYGGFVITNAAAGDPDVDVLVYVAAFAPDAGETVGSISASVPGSLLGPEALVIRPYTKADGTESADGYIAPAVYQEVFAADVEPGLAAVLAATQRPADLAILGEPSGEPAWATIPSFDLVATQDNVIPADAQRSMAERAGAIVTEVEASHSVAVSQPGIVADFIVEAVTSIS